MEEADKDYNVYSDPVVNENAQLERRAKVPSDTYRSICKDRFDTTHQEVLEVQKDTQYLRTKIDNGLSHLPNKMTWLQATFITLIIAIAGGAVAWTHQFGKIEERIDNHIEASTEMMKNMLEEISNIEKRYE